MSDETPPEEREREVPRWVQIPVGLILGAVTLALALASIMGLLLAPNELAPVLAKVVGFVLLVICFWVLEKCFRLITGVKNRGGLMSPTALRVLAVFFLVLPLAGLFTGYYRRMGAVAAFQAATYLTIFVGLRNLARRRETAANEEQ